MRGFEQIPWLYDLVCAAGERLGLRRWRERLVRGGHGVVLDVGCGTGRNLPLYPEGTRVVGLDPSREALLEARRRAPRVPLVRGTAEALPFRGGAFDTIVSGLVFCSVPHPDEGLAEVRRVLKPGGALRMWEHVRSTRRWKARLQDFIQPAWTRITGGCHPNRDTEAAVQRAGFRLEERRASKDLRLLVARK
jgi:ubiquinone/menaquinone biosynthesis C-methylase UbiE